MFSSLFSRVRFVLFAALAVSASSAFAGDDVYELIIKDHKFSPATITIPADTKVKLLVKNQDVTPEEFESYELNREKIIPGNSQAIIFIGPLSAGEYPFFGEFNQATAQGKILVK
ncbi:cupredoxin domain-containing protein [Idiomarina tyrosinivorans]|uniref:Cupredoxin domain-containing protein n=1 Tax=Idiomarina tyrosinivorans TaxID=1445662 RepID=A0A432ZSP2_9GAMM|nr:cupredoxin domain-containing protein [Idiomarina tyrosinivorans]RUO80848.1 cupredoxin domain-containing protein [Idiomarina tyrosinivorans]